MSLLLDALKRAEQEKLARGDRPDLQVVGQGDGPSAGAVSPQPAGPSSAAAANLELQPIGSAASGTGAKAQPGKAQTPAQAQVVFQAKAAQQAAEPKRGALYAAAAAITLAVFAAGAYVWYAMKSLSPTTVPAARLSPPAAPTPPPASGLPLAPSTAGLPPFSPDSVVPAPGTSANAASSVVTTTGAAAVPPPPAPAAAKVAPVATAEQLAQEVLRERAAQREPPLRLERTEQPARLSSEINGAYAALRQGDLAGARRGYQAALAADAVNVDAHLGIATLEARAGNFAAAAGAYRRALELDPRNETALAGMAALADAARPGTVESQLRQDVMRHPQSAALHFALGNVLAAQSRWSEAQGEYFEAHRLDPASADIAHNLAVSLDRLGQSRLAADFYRRALEAARAQPGQFDPAPVERRLAELAR